MRWLHIPQTLPQKTTFFFSLVKIHFNVLSRIFMTYLLRINTVWTIEFVHPKKWQSKHYNIGLIIPARKSNKVFVWIIVTFWHFKQKKIIVVVWQVFWFIRYVCKKYKQTKHEILYIIIQLKLHNNSTIRLLSSHYIIETKTCHHCRVSPPLLKIFVKGMVTIFRKNKKNNFNIKYLFSVCLIF